MIPETHALLNRLSSLQYIQSCGCCFIPKMTLIARKALIVKILRIKDLYSQTKVLSKARHDALYQNEDYTKSTRLKPSGFLGSLGLDFPVLMSPETIPKSGVKTDQSFILHLVGLPGMYCLKLSHRLKANMHSSTRISLLT